MSDCVLSRSDLIMDTRVTIEVVRAGCESAIERAFGWFHHIESCCSRFDPTSELMQLTARVGVPVPVSPLLFEAVQFAVKVAEETGGAFDPTVGGQMESRGFHREYRTGAVVSTQVPADQMGNYRDVQLDPKGRTITLKRPLILDLGAVAKGLAIDMAARELQSFGDFLIDAGGDIYAAGNNPAGVPWRVGIRHPLKGDEIIDSFAVSNQAICTSGAYERGQHILDPRTNEPAKGVASATVLAPNGMLADALATAVFVLPPLEGIALLDRLGLDGLIVTPQLDRYETRGLRRAA